MTQPPTDRPAEHDLIRVINYLWAFDEAAFSVGRFRLIGGKPKEIAVADALIQPFSRERLDEALRKTRAGARMPPVNCERVCVGPHTFYTVSDGQHRIAACRELGRPTAPAYIASQITVDARPLVIHQGPAPGLWLRLPDAASPPSFKLVVWLGDLTDGERAALEWLLAEAVKPVAWRPLIDVWDTWPVGAAFEIDGLAAYRFRKISGAEAERFTARSGVWTGRITLTRTDNHQELWARLAEGAAIDSD